MAIRKNREHLSARLDLVSLIGRFQEVENVKDWGDGILSLARSSKLSAAEADILLSGLKAWVICPARIYHSDNRDCPPADSKEFVRSSMLVEATRRLGMCFKAARLSQLKTKNYDASDLFSHPVLKRFPWDLYFALGGLSEAASISASGVWRLQLANQYRAAQAAAMVVHVVREGIEQNGNRSSRGQRLGNNTFYKRAATNLTPIIMRPKSGKKKGLDKKGISDSTVRGYWNILVESAPLIYAATLVDNGRLFLWLVSEFDPYFYDERGPLGLLESWFAIANAVAEDSLKSSDMLSPNWKPFAVAKAMKPPTIPSLDAIKKVISEKRPISIDDLA